MAHIDPFISPLVFMGSRTWPAATWQQTFALACQQAAKWGFPHIIYAPIRAHPDAAHNWSATTYPTDWQQVYADKRYLARNPVRHHSLYSHRPFTWAELELQLPKSQRDIFEDCRDTGMADAWVVPIHGPGGQAVAVGFACQHRDAMHPDVMPWLQMLAMRLYHSQDPAEFAPAIRLTPREQQLMQLLVEGLDNLQLADALKVSDNSVEWHLKNVYRKLGVRNRTAAAVKALKLGLVHG